MSTAIDIKVFIAEDNPLIRDRLAEMLAGVDGVAVVGEAESPDAAISGIRSTCPDYVVLDYQLVGGTAVDVLRAVHRELPATSFLVLTNHPDPQYRRVCLEAGASFFFDKSLEFRRVKDVIVANESLRR